MSAVSFAFVSVVILICLFTLIDDLKFWNLLWTEKLVRVLEYISLALGIIMLAAIIYYYYFT